MYTLPLHTVKGFLDVYLKNTGELILIRKRERSSGMYRYHTTMGSAEAYLNGDTMVGYLQDNKHIKTLHHSLNSTILEINPPLCPNLSTA